MEYGHLLIGLSLISGLMVRASASFAILPMLLYWTAHMNFPYIDNINNLLVDEHTVAAAVCAYLIVRPARHGCGLDATAAMMDLVKNNTVLRYLTA